MTKAEYCIRGIVCIEVGYMQCYMTVAAWLTHSLTAALDQLRVVAH